MPFFTTAAHWVSIFMSTTTPRSFFSWLITDNENPFVCMWRGDFLPLCVPLYTSCLCAYWTAFGILLVTQTVWRDPSENSSQSAWDLPAWIVWCHLQTWHRAVLSPTANHLWTRWKAPRHSPWGTALPSLWKLPIYSYSLFAVLFHDYQVYSEAFGEGLPQNLFRSPEIQCQLVCLKPLAFWNWKKHLQIIWQG